MRYEGTVRLGEGDKTFDAVAAIPDVESPEWFAVVSVDRGDAQPFKGEVTVTLVGGGLYDGWCGTAVISQDGKDDKVRLLGHTPLVPPVGG